MDEEITAPSNPLNEKRTQNHIGTHGDPTAHAMD
jgi:hypothetical protein